MSFFIDNDVISVATHTLKNFTRGTEPLCYSQTHFLLPAREVYKYLGVNKNKIFINFVTFFNFALFARAREVRARGPEVTPVPTIPHK